MIIEQIDERELKGHVYPLFIHALFSHYLLSAYFIASTLLCAGVTKVTKALTLAINSVQWGKVP